MGTPRSRSPQERRANATAEATRYVPVGPCHLNVELSAARAWRLLFEHQVEFLGSEGKTVRSPAPALERAFPRIAQAVRASLGTARLVRRRRRAGGSSLVLPVSGDLAMVRRSGAVKVLDHGTDRVFTVMKAPEDAAKLQRRYQEARRVASFPFAPEVLAADVDAGWFVEEFVRGRHPGLESGCTHAFDAAYLPLLAAFARAEPVTWLPMDRYVEGLASDVLAPDGLVRRLPAASRARTEAVVEALRERLAASPDASRLLPLTFSHGDFFSGNVVLPADGPPRAIDWAHVGRRSPLHDLYYVLMNHCVKVLPPIGRHERIREAIGALRARLAAEEPDRLEALSGALEPRDELRWLFYLECIQVPIVRCDDPDDRYVRAMVQRLDWFDAYERATSGTGLLP
jgi:aminoglycoside phosphotransferase (APT) family kinase protein